MKIKLIKNLKLKNYYENLMVMWIFGSYGTEYWRMDNSDIDVLVLINKRDSYREEFDIEGQ